ncbi:DUF2167 domain-containing protein [Paenibacillus oenotherae]|uniref:DUF2167 domain-containing protein n=1 Tax=Paenibacillus oenotherae TaxID=1435645 RepID=A0ABS7DBT4_9BACL|nr:DUF2167 domain-containing protein [Paenibacillus oenotherae]MBW7477234.1 DUF2167 domain-containing protein [Paenibacillus oenotherae]
MGKGKGIFRKRVAAFALVLYASVALVSAGIASAEGEGTDINWVEGTGQQVQLGKVASFNLTTDFVFLDGPNTVKFEEQYGDIPTGREIGSIFPMDQEQNWVVYFEYEESGHIADEEKNEIDADALLESYKNGNEEANKSKEAANQLFVDGWDIPPVYSDKLHSLKWSLLLHTGANEPLINYNVRLLTREGYISAILVSDPEHLAADIVTFEEQVLPKLTIVEGQRYADFNESTDKVAEYGLTGLILGGAGLAVAKKFGLLLIIKKFWYLIVVGIVGLGSFIWKRVRSLFGRRQAPGHHTESNSPDNQA